MLSQSEMNRPGESTAMKHIEQNDPTGIAAPQLEPVRFKFSHPNARTVCIAGTFNDWRPEAKPMRPTGAGCWLEKSDLAPGTYEYCFVVDGCWMPDPQAHETRPNPFGGRNSILTVTQNPEVTHRANATHSPLKNTNKPKNRKK